MYSSTDQPDFDALLRDEGPGQGADGVDAVEAVVVRQVRTGRLCAVNASGFLSFDSSSQ